MIKNILDKLNFRYTEAGSQQSKDFRNILNIGLNIEVKKQTVLIYSLMILVHHLIYIIL